MEVAAETFRWPIFSLRGEGKLDYCEATTPLVVKLISGADGLYIHPLWSGVFPE